MTFLTYPCEHGSHNLCNGNVSECLPQMPKCDCLCHTSVTEINFWTTKGEYGFLSNFWPAVQTLYGLSYATNENWYQAQKTTLKETHERIRQAPTPGEARRLGLQVELRPDWEEFKVRVMLEGLRAKFSQNGELRLRLLATGYAVLHEDSPTDMFWGKKGQDMLGKLLMRVRGEIR